MVKRLLENSKLGIFVIAGLLFLMLLLYMIGRNQNLFGATFILKVKFSNVQGLMSGNNVRVSGIEAGTVKKIVIINDTTIDVTMVIDEKMKNIIRKNAIVSIGTEGLVGNKVINIVPNHQPAALAEDGDYLEAKKNVDTNEMLETLSQTNKDIAVIASELKSTIQRINSSSTLWSLLNDSTIPANLRQSMANIKAATGKANEMATTLNAIVTDVKNGKGSAGEILTDTTLAYNLNEAVQQIRSVGNQADSIAREINSMVAGINNDIKSGSGAVHTLLKDSATAAKINGSLENIQKGTDGFNQNMEALKHSFLFRGYFRKQEKKKSAEQK